MISSQNYHLATTVGRKIYLFWGYKSKKCERLHSLPIIPELL